MFISQEEHWHKIKPMGRRKYITSRSIYISVFWSLGVTFFMSLYRIGGFPITQEKIDSLFPSVYIMYIIYCVSGLFLGYILSKQTWEDLKVKYGGDEL